MKMGPTGIYVRLTEYAMDRNFRVANEPPSLTAADCLKTAGYVSGRGEDILRKA